MDFSKSENLKESFQDLSNNKLAAKTFETEMRKSDNRVFPAEIGGAPIAGKGSKMLGLLWVIRDLSSDREIKGKIFSKQKELKEKIIEVEQMNDMMKGREQRFAEVVNELNELRVKFDLPPY